MVDQRSLPVTHFGPLGEKLYKAEIQHYVVAGVPADKDAAGHYVVRTLTEPVTGEITGLQINEDYLTSPVLPAFAEFQGVTFDQNHRYPPFYNSMFFLQPEPACLMFCARLVEASVDMVMQLDPYEMSDEDRQHPDVKYFSEVYGDQILQYQIIKRNVTQDGSRHAANITRNKLALDICRNSDLMREFYNQALYDLTATHTYLETYGIEAAFEKTKEAQFLFAINELTTVDVADFYSCRKYGLDLSVMGQDFNQEFWQKLQGGHTKSQEKRREDLTASLRPYFPPHNL